MYKGISYGLYYDSDRCRVSVDNIRLKFVYKYQRYSWEKGFSVLSIDSISTTIDNLMFIFPDFDWQWSYKDFFKIGAYCRTCRVSGLDWSFALLFGRYTYDSACRNVAPEVIFDYNPNKVPANVIQQFLLILQDRAMSCDLVRFDVAFDFPVSRDNVFFVRSSDSRRVYRLFDDGGAVTEYEGARASHGAIKVYDKTLESGLSVPVSRCEITVSGGKVDALPSLFPRMYSFSGYQSDFQFYALPFQVRACVIHPDLLDDMLAGCSRNTRKKYLALLDGLDKCLLSVSDWASVLVFLHSALKSYSEVRL